jgi:hypothetical protein
VRGGGEQPSEISIGESAASPAAAHLSEETEAS